MGAQIRDGKIRGQVVGAKLFYLLSSPLHWSHCFAILSSGLGEEGGCPNVHHTILIEAWANFFYGQMPLYKVWIAAQPRNHDKSSRGVDLDNFFNKVFRFRFFSVHLDFCCIGVNFGLLPAAAGGGCAVCGGRLTSWGAHQHMCLISRHRLPPVGISPQNPPTPHQLLLRFFLLLVSGLV